MQVKATLQHKILFKFPLVENFRRKWNLDRITVTKILKCFQTNWCRKRRKTFKIEKFVVLAEYFEQQTDCNRYRRETSKSRRSLREEKSVVFKFLHQTNGNHTKELSRVGHVILRTALKRYFRFPRNCKQLTGWSEEQYGKLWNLFSNFLWNYTY